MERTKKVNTIRTRFVKPYKLKYDKLVTNINCLSPQGNQSGIYFIKKEDTGKIVYVGYSASNLYKTIFRHFQQWNDTARASEKRKVYPKIGYQVKIIFARPQNAYLLEKYFIQKLKPEDNLFKYNYYLTEKEVNKCEHLAGEQWYIGPQDTPF